MTIARSTLTRQGQISIPTQVRRRLGIGPGSVIEWEEEGMQIVVRKAGRHSLDDTRQALGFEKPPRPRSLDELREGVRKAVRQRHARR